MKLCLMKQYGKYMPVLALLLLTTLGVTYVANIRVRTPQNGAVLGEVYESIHLTLTIRFNGKVIKYSSDAQLPGASLLDLITEFNSLGDILIEYRNFGEEDKITLVETFLSDEAEGVVWKIYVNNVEYSGKFNEKFLLDNDEVLIVYEYP